jgi:hypothetical protein
MSAQVIDNELVHALAARSCGKAKRQVLPGSHMIDAGLYPACQIRSEGLHTIMQPFPTVSY